MDNAVSEEKATRKEKIGWYFYDWANSAFSTTVISVFLGPYLTNITQAAAGGEGAFVYPLGIAIRAESFFPYMISLSVFLQVFFLPILGAIGDFSHRKKEFMGVFAYIGAFATMGMYFLDGTNYLLGGALLIIANLSFGAAIVFYNAYLPEISAPDERDADSSRGWAMGYLGGGLLLLINLILFTSAESIGLTTGHAVRISLASAGLWWAIFTLIPLATLRRRNAVKQLPTGESILTVGFKQLGHTIRGARNYPQTFLFLIAYLFYNDGIQTVISQASVFGSEALDMSDTQLTQLILLVQFVAFFGAILFGYIAKWVGTKNAIMASLVVWTGTVIYAWAILKSIPEFFALAVVIAIVLGGSQALSRSVYSLMIPKGQEAEYFSLYEVSERGTSWLGPLFFGLALQLTNDYRVAIVSVGVFFVIGLCILPFVDIQRAAREAGNEVPARG